jgi:beta-lactamase class A
MKRFTRRAAIGAGATTAAALALAKPALGASAVAGPAVAGPGVAGPGVAGPAAPASGLDCVRSVYQQQKVKAGGTWHSHIAQVAADGAITPVVEDDADFKLKGYSVQKLAVAVAVMDKIDRGLARLGDKLELTADIINGGSGIYRLHTVYGDQITIANFLTAMLLMSDNTAVRLCGLVTPSAEINEILAAKGFVHTRVEPVANPNRFYLGWTTPHETHQLLVGLVKKTILKPASCDFILSILRWQNGYHDGIRRNMSSAERSRVATRYGADFNTLGASRHEVGIVFKVDGAPGLVYSLFAERLAQTNNYGGTHPGVEAHAVIGRCLIDAVGTATSPASIARHSVERFEEVDGG